MSLSQKTKDFLLDHHFNVDNPFDRGAVNPETNKAQKYSAMEIAILKENTHAIRGLYEFEKTSPLFLGSHANNRSQRFGGWLAFSVSRGKATAARSLIESGYPCDNLLLKYVINRDSNKLKKLLKNLSLRPQGELVSVFSFIVIAFRAAVRFGDVKCAKEFLKYDRHQQLVEVRDDSCFTIREMQDDSPLSEACSFRQTPTVELLISCKASLEPQRGRKPLDVIVNQGFLLHPCYPLLIKHQSSKVSDEIADIMNAQAEVLFQAPSGMTRVDSVDSLTRDCSSPSLSTQRTEREYPRNSWR